MKVDVAKLKFYIFIFLIIIIILISLIFHAKGDHFLFYKDLKKISSMNLFPIIYISLYFISSFFPLPFLTFLGAAVFPFYKAFILSMIGNILFFIIMFYLARWLGRDYIEIYEKKHLKLKKLDLNIDKNAFLYVFLLRLFFIIPPEAVNIFAGLSKMKFRDYLFSSILGTIPVVLISILLVESYQVKEFQLFIIASILFASLIIVPLFFMKELKKYFRKA